MSKAEPRRCGAITRADGSVLWRVWAPLASRVDLVATVAGVERALPMQAEPRGYFRHVEPNVPEGTRYQFRLDGDQTFPDPCSLSQPDGVHGASAVVRTDRHRWSDHAWRGIARTALVFYEVHVGTFTPQGTFDAMIPRLESLRALGVTAIQLMPVAQFPGTRNWGYDGVYPYAVQESYGGPASLRNLVDACHTHGLALFLDVVYNHLGPEGNYLGCFGPYFTDRYKTAWGSALNYDGPGSDAVRDFVLENARMWLDEFHVDGLRLDAVHAIFDLGARPLLAEFKQLAEDVAAQTGRPRHIVAESDLNDPRLLLPPERGGLGLDAQWSDDFHHAVHVFLTGERRGYYRDFGKAEQLARVLEQPYLDAGEYSPLRDRRHGAPVPADVTGDRFVVAIQNHDQVGNRARGDRLSTLVSEPKLRLAASLMLFAPHLPLLFMGEEYGEDRPFLYFCSFCDGPLIEAVREGRRREFANFDWNGEVPDPHAEDTFAASQLSWSWPEKTFRAGLRRLYADLLAARREWPALRDFKNRRARLMEGGAVLELVRGRGKEPQAEVRVFFNLTEQTLSLVPSETHRVVFASERACYHGSRSDHAPLNELLPFECVAMASREC